MSKSINLITCMKFFKSIINNATEFAQENSKKKSKSLDELKTIRTNFCHILWMKSILTELNDKVNTALDVYDTTIEPIIKNVVSVVNDHPDMDNNTMYDMWNLNYHNNNDTPQEITKSWADMTEYDDICLHIKAMKDSGYPNCNNIQPIKDFKSSDVEQIEQKFSFRTDSKKLSYYKYEMNGTAITLPMVENLEEIPSCFYYFRGSRKYRRGIYMSPYEGIIMQVPEVTIVPYSMENANHFSMKCTQGKQCKNIRCTYAHPGTDYVKIGCVSRCPNAHSFGNKDTLREDIKLVNIEDIRIVSMYGLNDLFSAALWFSHRSMNEENVTKILNNLEVCDDYLNEELDSETKSN